jgi:D-beta-D-heptose 7-phosphate kinase/D-beta-D-heptose 1-phosphate adenosyltransferase
VEQTTIIGPVNDATALRSGFASARILVVGDLMLDRYLWGDVRRISPEAPVPVVCETGQSERPGGAANVVANLLGLGAQVAVAGFAGTDANGQRLVQLLLNLSANTDAVVRVDGRPTTTKTRILSGHQQMLRLDGEDTTPISADYVARLLEGVHQQLSSRPSAVILSDYAKGVLSESVCKAIMAEARDLRIPVLVDPKGRDYTKYTGATVITPNELELAVACDASPDHLESLLEAGERLRQQLNLDFLVFTRGAEGVSVIEAGRAFHIPAVAKKVYDVSGAGDTVIATVAAGLVAGLGHIEAVHLANVAAGVVVGKVGTVPIEMYELLEVLSTERTPSQRHKICTIGEILKRAELWRASKERIAFTDCSFDVLHVAQLSYLEWARGLGEHLVVAVTANDSEGVTRGTPRPHTLAADRARLVAALECVDAVVLIEPDKTRDCVKLLQPDVILREDDLAESRTSVIDKVENYV